MSELRSAPTGRPGWPPLSMLKALLPTQWYGLSDPELEDALADRLSFRRFVERPFDGGVPDETVLLVEADADVRKRPDGRPVTVEREAGFAKRRG